MNGSKPGTTRTDDTATAATPAHSTTKSHARHDHPTPTSSVRPGTSSLLLLAHPASAMKVGRGGTEPSGAGDEDLIADLAERCVGV